MVQITAHADEIQRARVAREEYLRAFCADMPATYAAMMPLTFDGGLLQKAEGIIRAKWKADAEAFQAEQVSPWSKKTAFDATLVDWSNLPAVDKIATGMLGGRLLGMPAPVKHGPGPDGVLYPHYPEVVEAQKNAHRTAEWVASVKVDVCERRARKAESAWVKATNEDAPEATVEKLRKAADKARKECDEANAEFQKLRANPIQGLKIVREALSEEEIRREREAD